jgi:DNA-binding response OmpR family regulator
MGLHIDEVARNVFMDAVKIELSPIEYHVLAFLFEFKGKACSTKQISIGVWHNEYATKELMPKYVSLLRKKIELNPSKPRYIKTVRRHGYYRLDI